MTENRIACLPIHVWDRELDARLLTSVLLAANGYHVILGHEYNIAPLYKFHANLFHIGCGRPIYHKLRTDEWYKQIIERGGYVGLVTEEGMNDLALGADYLFAGITKESVMTTSKIYGWCQLENKYLQEASNNEDLKPIIDSKYTYNLNSRLELLSPWISNNYFVEKKEALRTTFGKYILISDNFGGEAFGSSAPLPAEDNINILKINIDKKKELLERTSSQEAVSRQARLNFCKVIRALCQKFPDVHFVMRPHPVSDPKFWHDKLSIFRNLTIIYYGACEPWLLGSKCVVHSGCTLGIQAQIADIPDIDLHGLIQDGRKKAISTLTSDRTPTSWEELQLNIKEVMMERNQENQKEIKSIQGDYFKLLKQNTKSRGLILLNEKLDEDYKLSYYPASLQILKDAMTFVKGDAARKLKGDELRNFIETIDNKLLRLMPNFGKSRIYTRDDILTRVQKINTLLFANKNLLYVTNTSAPNVFIIGPTRN